MNEKIPLEKTVVNGIVGWIRKHGYHFVYKTHGSAYQRSGIPDITLIGKNGRFIGLEVKRPKLGRLTGIQAATLNAINLSGGFGVVVTSLEEAQAAILAAENGEQGKEYVAP